MIAIHRATRELPDGPARITLGSLFDGIGAFPYAASFFGVQPIWASEILPNAISITKRHFPAMAHLGDITRLDGGAVPPADIVAFGSPCQSFSIAAGSARSGFAGKSGLFMEAARIIKEMRRATNGSHPKIVLFENVFGLLSCGSGSHAGRDYQTALEALCEAEIPMPRSGRWANAGMAGGGGFNLAWIVKDASQHYRVPQRRRRLYLVVDFTGPGDGAAQILFVPKSLRGYFEARGPARQGAPAAAERGAGGGGEPGPGAVSAAAAETAAPAPACAAFMAGQARNARGIAFSEAAAPTLKGSPSGLNQIPCVVGPQLARTLTARGDSSPCADRGQNIVAFAQNQSCETRGLNGIAGRLAADAGAKRQTYIAQPGCLTPWARQGARIFSPDGVAPTLAGADLGGGRNPAGLAMSEFRSPAPAGGRAASGQAPPQARHAVRRLTPTECERLMAFPDGYTATGHDGKAMSDTARYSLLGNSVVVNVLAYIMQNAAERLGGGRQCRSR